MQLPEPATTDLQQWQQPRKAKRSERGQHPIPKPHPHCLRLCFLGFPWYLEFPAPPFCPTQAILRCFSPLHPTSFLPHPFLLFYCVCYKAGRFTVPGYSALPRALGRTQFPGCSPATAHQHIHLRLHSISESHNRRLPQAVACLPAAMMFCQSEHFFLSFFLFLLCLRQ